MSKLEDWLKQRNENEQKMESVISSRVEMSNDKLIADLKQENAELKQQVEKMKCCQNCKNLISLAYGEFSCDLYGECKHCSKWEIKENG